jgi:alpha-tubulin suppressor-like RCC1 family protein
VPLIAWGNTDGYPTVSQEQLSAIANYGGVKSVVTNKGAFAVLSGDGNVYAWGSPFYGGSLDGVDKITTATALAATDFAFAAVLEDKTVRAWGDVAFGGRTRTIDGDGISRLDSNLNGNLDTDTKEKLGTGEGASKLYANRVAFAALTTSGRVVTWGDQANGGDSSSVDSSLVDVQYIKPSGSAFTAVLKSGGGSPTRAPSKIASKMVREATGRLCSAMLSYA